MIQLKFEKFKIELPILLTNLSSHIYHAISK